MLSHFYYWWISLSEGVRAAIVGAIVATFFALIRRFPNDMIRAFHRRNLIRLEKAENEIRYAEWNTPGPFVPDPDLPISLERRAERAGIWLWVARWSENYRVNKEFDDRNFLDRI